MQLLKITTTPIEYKIQVENASLRVNQNDPIQMDAKVTPSKLQIRTDNIEVQLDTSKARNSLGYRSSSELIREASQKGVRAAMDATAQYAAIGNQMAQIQNNQEIPSILAEILYRQPTTQTVFLPIQGPDISWKPNKIDMKYEPATIHTQWQEAKFNMEYVPSRYQMSILQYPKVTIEYVGGPNYVPPSADPNYEEE
ncbi:MAG: DUF6470 family protein [Oscillospiraceae bacterium]